MRAVVPDSEGILPRLFEIPLVIKILAGCNYRKCHWIAGKNKLTFGLFSDDDTAVSVAVAIIVIIIHLSGGIRMFTEFRCKFSSFTAAIVFRQHYFAGYGITVVVTLGSAKQRNERRRQRKRNDNQQTSDCFFHTNNLLLQLLFLIA